MEYEITQGAFCPEVTVNEELYEKAKKIISKNYKFISCSHKMTGEDFGFISELYPSLMLWLGTGEGKKIRIA